MTKHFQAAHETTLKNIFFEQIIASEQDFLELCFLGCFYINGVRTSKDQNLQKGDYVRMHLKPKRYSIGHLSAKDLIHSETVDYWIIKKPSFLPVHATLDNQQEHLLAILEKEFKDVFLTQRLDIETSGLIFFAKHKEAQRAFNFLLAKRQVQKIYQAVSSQTADLGLHSHYMDKNPRCPKILVDESIYLQTPELYHLCQLKITEITKRQDHYYHTIELLTGRSHQIRAQMAKLNAPLLGDTMYGGPPHSYFGLRCVQLSFVWNGKQETYISDCQS